MDICADTTLARLGLAGVLTVMTGITSLWLYGIAVISVKLLERRFETPPSTWVDLALPWRWRRRHLVVRLCLWGMLLFVGWVVWSLIDTFMVAGQLLCR